MKYSDDEFPLLSALGLYAAEIRGDGNCLFNALSDQMYGDQKQHNEIRRRVVDYMRENAEYYKQFISVHPGGGTRRNPKRKNAGAYSTPMAFAPPTPAEIDRVFEDHLKSMAKGGTYGDNIEIMAFANAFSKDVKIYQRDFAYMIEAGVDGTSPRTTLHIAYHVWEHYSSIRNLDGPHSGMPNVLEKILSPEEEQASREKLANTPIVQPWMIDVVLKSLPFLADKPTIKRTLEECHGSIDAAVSKLLDAEEGNSTSSQPESSSVERDHDSDDDAVNGPNKRRNRRTSKATRILMANNNQHRHEAFAKLEPMNGSQESLPSSSGSQAWEDVDEPLQASTRTVKQEADGESDYAPDSEAATSSDAASSQQIQKVPSRLKINFSPAPSSPTFVAGKSHVRQSGPGRPATRPSARQKKELKKQAQKAARKQRAQADARSNNSVASPKSELPLHLKTTLEQGLKTIHI